jgi:hypothetical protein
MKKELPKPEESEFIVTVELQQTHIDRSRDLKGGHSGRMARIGC